MEEEQGNEDRVFSRKNDTMNEVSLREAVSKIIYSGINWIINKLKKPSMENSKTLAEIDQIYNQINLDRAEQKRILMELNQKDFMLRMERFKVMISMYKEMVDLDKNESSQIYQNILDSMMHTIKLCEQGDIEDNM